MTLFPRSSVLTYIRGRAIHLVEITSLNFISSFRGQCGVVSMDNLWPPRPNLSEVKIYIKQWSCYLYYIKVQNKYQLTKLNKVQIKNSMTSVISDTQHPWSNCRPCFINVLHYLYNFYDLFHPPRNIYYQLT